MTPTEIAPRLIPLTFHQMVSLGRDCRVQYQLMLARYVRGVPPFNGADFKAAAKAVFTDAASLHKFPFDYNVTPFSAVTNLVERDMAGGFEREDLFINEAGHVQNFDGTQFMHSFSRLERRVTPDILIAEFDAFRQQMDHMCRRMLGLFHSPGPILYVAADAKIDEITAFRAMLRRKFPTHTCMVLSVVQSAAPRGLVHRDDDVALFEIQPGVDKPFKKKWQGDDRQWALALDRIDIAGHPIMRPAPADEVVS